MPVIRRARPAVEHLEDRLVPSTLIPVANHRDLVYDAYRNVLDITTSNGTLQQFNVMSQSLRAPQTIGGSLAGADITNDGSALFVAEQVDPNGQEVLHRVNLTNGVPTNLYYPSAPGEGGWSLALGPGTKGLQDDIATNGAPGPLRSFDTLTGQETFRNDSPGQYGGGVSSGTLIRRSADRSLFLIADAGPSGELFTYSPQTDTFSRPYFLGTSLKNALTAVNRNGTLFAVEVNGTTTVFDRNFNVRMTLPGLDGGLTFDPTQDLLWGAGSQSGMLVAYDTNTWAMRYQMPVGEAVPRGTPLGNGAMTVSGDGRWVFLATPGGVREFASPFAPGPATMLSFGNLPTSATAGTPFTVTLTATDSAGRTATGYLGTVHFVSSDAQAVLTANYTFTPADLGSHTFTVTLKTANSQMLGAYDPYGPGSPPANVMVVPGPATTFQLAPVSSGVQTSAGAPAEAAGYAFTLNVTALDAYGNPATNYTGKVHFSSTDPAAKLPPDVTFPSQAHGRIGFSGVTLNTAGYQTITVTDVSTPRPPVQATGSLVIPVANYIPGLHFTLGTSTATPTAGAPFDLTVTALDEYNEVATHYLGTVTFSMSDPGTGAAVPANYIFTAADAGVHTFAGGVTFVTAGSQGIGVHDIAYITGQTATGITVTVSPAAASTFVVAGFPSAVTAGSAATFGVTAKDAYGNVATGYSGTVHFSSSDGGAVLPADATLTNGTATFSASLVTAGTQSLTATDAANPALTGSEVGVTVSPAAASVLVLSAPSSVTASTPFTFTVTLLDAYGNVAAGYVGTVHFAGSDAAAVLPADYTFTAADAGVATFTAVFATPGSQTLTATDAVDGLGTTLSIVAA